MPESNTFFTILTLFTSCMFASICYFIAKKKQRNEKIWAILGLFFGFFAFFTLLLLNYFFPIPKKQKIIKKPIRETSLSGASVHNESAAALNGDDAFDPPKQPRIGGNKSISWYYIDQHKENSIKGPFSINDLRKQIHKNNLDGCTYIWCEEFEEWTIISDFSNASLLLDADFIE